MSENKTERTPQDYAIEHAGYLATAATGYLDAINAEYVAQMNLEEDDSEENREALEEAIEIVGDANRTLRNRIYEFEKRRDRAAAIPQAVSAEPSGETMAQREEVCAAWYELPDNLRAHPAMKRLYRALGGVRMDAPKEQP